MIVLNRLTASYNYLCQLMFVISGVKNFVNLNTRNYVLQHFSKCLFSQKDNYNFVCVLLLTQQYYFVKAITQ